MDTTTVKALIELNNRFYAQHAASFSATRSAPWHGWEQLVEVLHEHGRGNPQAAGAARVLDMACGNLRFEHFLASASPSIDFDFHAVDSCPALMASHADLPAACAFHQCDVLAALIEGVDGIPEVPLCDLSVSFGFMHHIPDARLRSDALSELIAHTAPNGLVVVSFWQFMNDERLAKKAARADETLRAQCSHAAGAPRADLNPDGTQRQPSSEGAPAMPAASATPTAAIPHAASVLSSASAVDISQLDEHDHFLGWQSDPSPLRYCHHFDEAEIDELVASVGTAVREVTRYSADGASGTLNRYLVLERLS